MARRADLGWWGRHPYVYTVFTTTAAVACWATVLVAVLAVPEAAIGVGLCVGLFGVLMTLAAGYAWHWLLTGRHRDRRANERMRWKWDLALLRAGRVLLWLCFLGLLVMTADSLYGGWRFSRYGVAAEAVVTRVDGSLVTLAVAAPDGERLGVLQKGRGDPRLAAGDHIRVVYDPGRGADDVILADHWPYAQASVLAVGATVAGAFVLVPFARRSITESGLAHRRSSSRGVSGHGGWIPR